MRAVVFVIALIVAFGFAYIADIYWYGGALPAWLFIHLVC